MHKAHYVTGFATLIDFFIQINVFDSFTASNRPQGASSQRLTPSSSCNASILAANCPATLASRNMVTVLEGVYQDSNTLPEACDAFV
jgi:hypothetical protein